MRVYKNSPHKPLLLLLCVSKVKKGCSNHFLYDNLEDKLHFLIKKYNKNKTAKINPQYPFVFLGSSSKLWESSITKLQCKNPDAPIRSEVLGQTAKLAKDFHEKLLINDNCKLIIDYILNNYFESKLHKQILIDLI